MSRTTARPRKADRASRASLEPAGAATALVTAWWASVLAGDVYQPHPVYGALKAQLDGGRLRLSGELENEADRNELVRQARERIGHGIDRVDVSRLTVPSNHEKVGILSQTLISAFPNREAAEFARAFVVKHSRVAPLQDEIVDSTHADNLRALLPEEFIDDAGKALDSGEALLIVQVDETAAFRVRELLEEDTRSEWTIAVPPQLSTRTGRTTIAGSSGGVSD
jgi:hypothetical protein